MAKYGKSVLWVASVVLAFIALTSIARRATLVQRLSRQVATATAVYARVDATHAYLQTQVALATEGANADLPLREEGGMARPGDQVIVPVPVGTPAPSPSIATPPPTPTPQPPPWKVWWRLFFGPSE